MKFSLWTDNGALNSAPVFEAFAKSVMDAGHDTLYNSPHGDVDVIWSVLWNGRMRNNKSIWDSAQSINKPVIVLEVGGIVRGETWKVGINGINRDAYFGSRGNNGDRASLLGLTLKPWRKSGDYILICGQHDKSHQWQGMPAMSQWAINVMDEIRQRTDMKIVFRPHPRCPLTGIEHEFDNVFRQQPVKVDNTYDDFDLSFEKCHAVVSWTSNPGIHAVINGIPAFTSPSSLAWPVANKSFKTIVDPEMPDREQWLNDYAHTEYTVKEIASGQPLQKLLPKLVDLLA